MPINQVVEKGNGIIDTVRILSPIAGCGTIKEVILASFSPGFPWSL